MSILPKLKVPQYETELPSTKETIKFRPFLVADEKLLLIAMQSEDNKVIVKELIRVIDDCVTFDNKSKFKRAADLTITDLEWIFLKLRINSKGEMIEINLKCEHCEQPQPVMVNFEDAFHSEGKQEKVIMLDEEHKIGLTLKVPGSEIAIKYSTGVELSNIFDIIVSCVDTIIDGDTIHTRKDISEGDIIEFLDNLQATHFEKIQNWFNALPKIKIDVKYSCMSCKKDNTITLTGLQDFFGSLSAMKPLRGSID